MLGKPVFLLLFLGFSKASYDLEMLLAVLEHSCQRYELANVPIFMGLTVEGELRDLLESQLSNLTKPVAKYNFDSKDAGSFWSILRNYINQNSVLSIVFSEKSNDEVWTTVDRRLRRLRSARLLVLMSSTAEIQELKLLFNKLWQLQFLNVVVIWNGGLYTYEPFPTIKMLALKLQPSEHTIFPTISKNMQGYEIATSVENDIPRIFCITDEHGKLHVNGFAYQIFRHFLKRLNATLRITNQEAKRSIRSSVNMSSIMTRIATQELEISMHPYTTLHETKGIIGYPMFKVELCLIVPVHNEIERYMYLFRPFTWSSWLLIIFAWCYVGLMLSRLNPALGRINSWPQRLTLGLLESLTQIFALPSTLQPIHRPKLIYFFACMLLGVLGFFITTWYCNLLSSFLTTFLIGQQIDTFEQIIAAQLHVMVKYYERHLLLEHVPLKHLKRFERLVVPVNASVQVAHLLNFNTSFAYPVTAERWEFLKLQQQYANRPIYRWSNICFGMPTVGYPLRLDSHLEQHMTQFVLDVQMSGLDQYWLVSDFEFALRAGYVRLIENILPFKAMNYDSLKFAWFILIAGWCLATLIFFIEFRSGRRGVGFRCGI